MSARMLPCVLLVAACLPEARAGFTRNIMLTGYWPPTNHMVRPWSTNPEQNPDGWIGKNWENRGYDIYSFFAEFSTGGGKGVGDFEVDYQDTSADFWRIVEEIRPVAIVTFSLGGSNRQWEIEQLQRNLETWAPDYQAPRQPTPSPPDSSVPAGHIRESTLPMAEIEAAVDAADIGVNARIDATDFGGGFLSEFIAYHAVWYQSLHADPTDDYWNIAAGHIHVGNRLVTEQARQATEITLRTLTDYLDTQIPEPASAVLLSLGLWLMSRRR